MIKYVQLVAPMNALARPHSYDDFVDLLSRTIGAGDGTPVSMILVDIDWFGRLNQEQGRGRGDEEIQALTRFLVDRAPESGKVFRYGGDAFMVLLPGTEKEQAFLVAESLRGAFETQTAKSPLTISCGVAAFPDDGDSVAGLVRKVSEALYRAKLNGRNRVALAREEKMVTKTVHYTQGQLEGLSRLAKREGLNEATLLREALDDLLRKHNS
jgi:diguanylate cyclase (GGDEF)-like protein